MKRFDHIGVNIKDAMGEMNAAELSRISGVPAMTIGRILKGQVIPSLDILDRLAHALKIPLSAIIAEDKELEYIILRLARMTTTGFNAIKTILKI
jgi:transcriptional regulator with XRE-family HTH domain